MSRSIEVEEKELNLPNLCPNKDKLMEYGERARSLRDNIKRVRDGFLPNADASKLLLFLLTFPLELIAATRFSSKPAHKNTFGNFQQDTIHMPGYISEKERLGGKLAGHNLQEKVNFQQVEKEKNKKVADSKIASKKLHVE